MGVLDRKPRQPDLAAMVKAAVSDALGQQAKPAHQPAPSKPPRLAGVLRALNAAPAPAPKPATPPPARLPPQLASVALQRGSDGKLSGATIATANGSRHDITIIRRDELGRLDMLSIDGRRAFRAVRGYYGEVVGLVPVADAPD